MNRLALLAAGMACIAAPVSAETLRDAVAAAYDTNPQLAEARARQEALAETPEQARAQGRLTAEADGSGGYDRSDYGKGGVGSVSATLPIWTGGRVPAAVRAAKGDVAAGAAGLRDTEAGVLETVVGAYADLLYAQQAVDVARADIDLLGRQVAEARSRYALGQATRTDVAQLEAQHAAAIATLADAQGSAAGVAATYRAAVGHDPGALESQSPRPALPADLGTARRWAIDANPLVRQQRLTAQADAARIAQQRAEGNPSLALGGTYGYAGSGRLGGYNDGAVAGVTLKVPLLTGGLVASRVRQAEATYRADRFATDAAEREATRSVETAWANLIAAGARADAGTQAVDAATLALKGVRAEYAFSLRTTTEILIADESLRSAQLALARSHSDLLIAQAALLRAAGRLDRDSYEITDAPTLNQRIAS
ncbi:TolC family protein [Sphingomonas abietis]|uniref:TolC family protein n=1 Tax=Sphingomonas abietis TaxID=3012344 RepID=A0ABY7NLD9_9SPHN|nr:TolC family protein [Sphingomonas abietis]WBO22328.1 TolC family protein [Sphingomonas abietis]